ncbi:MAG TPA: hypothetical protein VGE24_13875 [Emticicia sp.]
MMRKIAFVISLTVVCLISCKKTDVLKENRSTEVSNELLEKEAVFSEKDQVLNNASDKTFSAEFRGIFLGKEVVFSEKDSVFKNISGKGYKDSYGEYSICPIINKLYLTQPNDIHYNDKISINVSLGLFKDYGDGISVPDSTYNYLKRMLKVGVQKESLTNTGPIHWSVGITLNARISYKWQSIKEGAYIEILEVREVDTKTITTKLDRFQLAYYPKAFWVTYKIKANFKDYGDIDGILKVKYLINRFYLI